VTTAAAAALLGLDEEEIDDAAKPLLIRLLICLVSVLNSLLLGVVVVVSIFLSLFFSVVGSFAGKLERPFGCCCCLLSVLLADSLLFLSFRIESFTGVDKSKYPGGGNR
jgi:hypothetical protein